MFIQKQKQNNYKYTYYSYFLKRKLARNVSEKEKEPFNHIGKKKITSDPTPIQVEMRKYEKDVDTAFIENAGRKGHEHDVS